MVFEAIIDQQSRGEWAVHETAQKGRMFASAGQASDEHPVRHTLLSKPLRGVGTGALAGTV